MSEAAALGLRFYTDGADRSTSEQDRLAESSRSLEAQVIRTTAATKAASAPLLPLTTNVRSLTASESELAAMAAQAVAAIKTQEVATTSLGREIVDSQREAALYREEMNRMRAQYDPLFAASMRYATALEEINRLEREGVLTAGMAARARAEAERGLDAIGPASAKAGAGINRFSQTFSQVGYQVQDSAVQMAMGADALMVIGQQLPQALGAFRMPGYWGIIISGVATLVAVGTAVAPMLMDWGDEAKTAEDAIDDMAEAVDGAVSAIDAAKKSNAELAETYGSLAGQARAALRAQQELDVSNAMRSVTTGLNAGAGEKTGGSFRALLGASDDDGSRPAQQRRIIALRALREDYRLADDAISALRAKVESLFSASDLGGQVRAASDLQAALRAAYGSTDGMPDDVREVYQSLSTAVERGAALSGAIENAGGALTAGVEAAKRLADEIARASNNAASIELQGVDSLKLARIRLEFIGDPVGQAVAEAAAKFDASTAIPDGAPPEVMADIERRRRVVVANAREEARINEQVRAAVDAGRRGVSSGQSLETDEMREAQRVYDETRTAAERYQIELGKIDDLLRSGAISQDTHKRATEGLKDEFDGTKKAAADAAGAIRSAFDGLFDDPQRALKQLAAQLAQMAVYMGLSSSLPTIFGTAGIIPLLGGRASGGSVTAGGMYQVNERGTELFVPSSNGTIYPANKLGGAGQVVNVNNFGAQEDVQIDRRRGPDGEEILDVTIRKRMAAGAYDGAMKSRYGHNASKVIR